MKNNKGFAPIWIVVGVVVVGITVYALVSRATLKSFFQPGDKPAAADKSAPKEQNPTKDYVAGDTVVHSQPVYQAKVLTQGQAEFKLDAVQSVTFRWTPVVPKPQQPVTYRLKVWQLMQGQTSAQAMKTNHPIITKDVASASEVTVNGIYNGPCKPPYLCDFVWSVEAVTAASAPAGGAGAGSTGTGTTQATTSAAADATVPTSTKSSDGSAY